MVIKYAIIEFILILLILIISQKRSPTYKFDMEATTPIKGLLAIMIVMGHIGNVLGYSYARIMNFGVPVVCAFFFITGYGLMSSYLRKGTSYLDGFLKKRYSKILPLLILLSIIMILIKYFCYHLDLDYFYDDLQERLPPLHNSWFIYTSIFLYFLFYISGKSEKTNVPNNTQVVLGGVKC